MSTIKHLVTSGCSFSLTASLEKSLKTQGWPHWVSQSLGVQLHNTAMGSQGNDLICRKAIHCVQRLLDQGVLPSEILVGFMWSGPDRKDFYSSEVPKDFLVNESGWLKNPVQFVETDSDTGGWVLMSAGWMHHYSKLWYRNFYDQIGAYINTYERIHWAQSYLQSKGIKYFMGTYMSNVVNYLNEKQLGEGGYPETCRMDPNIQWMHNSIDWSKFLPVMSYSHWCAENHNDFEDYLDHPQEHHAQAFSQKVIVPFVQKHILADTVS